MAPEQAPAPTKEEILARVENDGIQFINLQFTDVMGIVKSVTIPAGIFAHVIDGGQWIDGSSIAGFTRIAESDMYLVPDLSTYSVLPWETETLRRAAISSAVITPGFACGRSPVSSRTAFAISVR